MANPNEQPLGQRHRILVIDDDTDFRTICRLTLEGSGYDVSEAASGIKALEAVRSQGRPDLVLLDYMIPGMDGIQVMKFLEDFILEHDVPVVFVSAISERKIIIQALIKGARDYLIKPFGPEELLQTVATHLHLQS